jgi:hypothetical protein
MNTGLANYRIAQGGFPGIAKILTILVKIYWAPGTLEEIGFYS